MASAWKKSISVFADFHPVVIDLQVIAGDREWRASAPGFRFAMRGVEGALHNAEFNSFATLKNPVLIGERQTCCGKLARRIPQVARTEDFMHVGTHNMAQSSALLS